MRLSPSWLEAVQEFCNGTICVRFDVFVAAASQELRHPYGTQTVLRDEGRSHPSHVRKYVNKCNR
jgi:hypothetical protein